MLVLLATLAAATESAAFDTFVARVDADGDGTVGAEEYRRVGEEGTFDAIDRDADGGLSPAELQAWIRVTPPRPADVVPALGGDEPPPPGQAGEGPSASGPPPAPAAEEGLLAALRARVGDRLLPFVGLVAALLGVLLAEVLRAKVPALRRRGLLRKARRGSRGGP